MSFLNGLILHLVSPCILLIVPYGEPLPTITAPKASGLPHSFVVSACNSSSPVLSDSVSGLLPGAGIKPALAAFRKAFSQAETLAAKPSEFEERWRVKSE